jgi:hypothetical protein
MMQIPVSSPAVLGRLKNFAKPYDFVLAPIISDGRIELEKQAEKPILITRYARNSAEWLKATYYNVRTGKPCCITLGDSKDPNVVPVKSYRQILNWYPYNPEHKSLAPGGQTRCDRFTRGILERDHVIAETHRPCGKEMKRKLDQGLIEHPDIDKERLENHAEFRCRVYENGRVAASAEMLRKLSNFSEREIEKETGIWRNNIRSLRHGKHVTGKVYRRIVEFLRKQESVK